MTVVQEAPTEAAGQAPSDEAARSERRGLAGLLRPFLGWIVLSSVCGIAAGAATVALLGTINQVLNQSGPLQGQALYVFIGLCLVALAGRAVSDISTNLVGQRLVAQVRKMLARQILSAPIDALERYRTHRLMPVLTQDVDMISDVAFTLSSTVIALATALGCLVYLAWLSPAMFGVLLVMLLLGTACQLRYQARGMAGFWQARDMEETLHKAYRGISEGAKELRMNRERRHRVYRDGVAHSVDRIRDINWKAINTYVTARAFGSALFFLLIALILGWATLRGSEPGVLSGFVLVLLFLKGPMDQIINTLPSLGRARVALKRVADLAARFATPEAALADASGLDTDRRPAMERGIELRGASYTFDAPAAGQPGFVLGPIDLTVRRGELLFVVGDNGSGKTTLIKLLLGLYMPSDGAVLLDGKPVGHAERDDYRQLFGTVLSDFFLFEDLPGGQQSLPETAQPYLQRLELAHKVSVQEGAFSTVDLSTGQRKRLALVHAYLEGRPVLVFDEWAADQDPAFRHLFYTELLPELRAQGRSIVVISHDDRYFHVADRIVHMRAGRVDRIEAPASLAA
ncbi:cyclic peptide export ABC transporter [Bordetella genomosp. 13]|uniref:cyclic peptide export ABC transporter n=1 Tax=Bordetella genomosp. 13 TaxID=463040 RepID=UPI0011A40068|nr:cyclic peptide export ABC transporter [Bordetella genomosp. 13]